MLIIGSAGFGVVLDALHPAQRQLARDINPKVFTPREWRNRLQDRDPFLREVVASKKLFLVGAKMTLKSWLVCRGKRLGGRRSANLAEPPDSGRSKPKFTATEPSYDAGTKREKVCAGNLSRSPCTVLGGDQSKLRRREVEILQELDERRFAGASLLQLNVVRLGPDCEKRIGDLVCHDPE